MKVSVILPTKDRGPAIAETIESLLALDFPVAEHEIVIVDNLSSPENQKQLQGLASEHSDRIKYVREEKLGLCNARNCGIHNSEGEFLVFLDDDAIVPRYWLSNIIAPFADPEVFATGGKVIAKYTTPPPIGSINAWECISATLIMAKRQLSFITMNIPVALIWHFGALPLTKSGCFWIVSIARANH